MKRISLVDAHVYGGAIIASVCAGLSFRVVELVGGVLLGSFLVYLGLRK